MPFTAPHAARVASSALMLLAASCQRAPETTPTQTQTPATATASSGLAPCDPVLTDVSMVVRDQATIASADFSFTRTITAIRNSSGGASTTNAALVSSLLAGLTPASQTNAASGLAMATDPRPAEASLSAAGLLANEMRPIALFNRFDLAPQDGSHCGEYRIVYGRYPNSTFDRFLLIFEAVLPNPNPGAGLAGCMPVALFWHGLSDPAMTPATRAAALANFYFVGLPGFDPVVTHANYGVPLGQVRSNMFRSQPWMLREWRTSFNGGGQPVFVVDTDKQNPLAEFYSENSSHPNPSLFATEQVAFRGDFLSNQLPFLTNGVVPVSVSARCDVVNGVGSAFPDRFNEFQGDSQFGTDTPLTIAAGGTMPAAITTALGASPLTATHVLNRAGTQSCGGCHQFSNGVALGFSQTWPSSAGFVHVSEQGAAPPALAPLSQALTECFLPARRLILQNFVCSGAPAPDAGVVDTGVGSPDASNPIDASTPDTGPADTGVVDAGAQACGGPYGQTCGPYEFCDFDGYNVCGATGPGVCAPRPVGCAYGTEVCGCDGVTYASECHAQQAGTDVASNGACGGVICEEKPPVGCCFEDSQCSTGRTQGQCVGAVCGKQGGVCKPFPTGRGQCWDDGDCGRGQVCSGEIVCPCGALCKRADQPGMCVSIRVSVTNARTAVLSAPSPVLVEELDRAVDAARAAEAAQPGAFWPRRRSH